ncbi:MAG: ATP-binding cassette domain-containing protein [Microscillaceae bacterium]|nr:ATP-binding cassette domain-containing protein [Microscillaceae bacterium]MDW8459982.1 ATP-binding cassette domain-containing protein [Cytophagales bacterium]
MKTSKDLLHLTHIVQVKDLTVQQGSQIILEKVNFEIEKGDFYYLIGKTGSGKTSLLRTLYADLPIAQGQAQVAGFDLHVLKRRDIPFLRRKIGIIFQDFQLLTDRNVFENLKFVLQATGWKDKTKMQQRIEEVLTLVGLQEKVKKMPYQLSGGEQQRIAIARALLNEPLILLADEPTGNLDPEVANDILLLFQKINRSGTAILMATHQHLFLENYPSHTLICQEGKVLRQI